MDPISSSRMEDIVINTTLHPYEPVFTFNFERTFPHEERIRWFRNNWRMSIVMSVVYVALLFAGRAYMSSRKPFNLRISLAVWSAGLAVFSWVGMVRSIAGAYDITQNNGWHALICDPIVYKGLTGFWLWIFTVSKLPELGDTVFIVLRKQNLIFLHWYHHITVLVYSWYSFPQVVSLARAFSVMNFTVHSLMYSYYAIKASKLIRIPNWIGILITSLQITQMLVGCIINGYAYSVLKNGGSCATNDDNLRVSFLVYSSYLLLFLGFFYNRYMAKPSAVAGEGKTRLKATENLREKKGQ